MSIHATGAALDSLAADAPQFQTNGGDWDEVLAQIAARDEEERMRDDRIVLNMGPVHPSTHGVLRLVLEVEGEQGVPHLHPGRHLRNPYGLRGPLLPGSGLGSGGGKGPGYY